MEVSVREVFDLAQRCFEAAGFEPGSAHANAQAIWWLELYRSCGLTALHEHLDDLEEWDRARVTLRERNAGVSVVDGAEQPSLVSANPVLDLSCAQADRHGVGVTYATTCADDGTLPALGYLAYRAAERGLSAVVLYTASDDRAGTVVGTPDLPQPLVADARLAATSAAHRSLEEAISAGLIHGRHEPLTQLSFARDGTDGHGTADACLLERLLDASMETARRVSIDDSYVVVCVDPGHPRQSGDVESVPGKFVDRHADAFTRVFDPSEVVDRGGTLVHEGVEVDRDVWEALFDYGSGVLAPPFEGSEMDAGFGLN